MAFLLTKKRALQLVLLLWCLPSAAYAFDDNIISQVLEGILAFVVGVGFVFWGLSTLLFRLIKTLKRAEQPEMTTDSEVAAAVPVVPGKVHPGLIGRVVMLSLPLQLVGQFAMVFPAAYAARFLLPHGAEYLVAVLICGFLSLHTAVLGAWLWRTQRPSMALGIGLGGGLVTVGMAGLLLVRGLPNGAMPLNTATGGGGPDQLPPKVYT